MNPALPLNSYVTLEKGLYARVLATSYVKNHYLPPEAIVTKMKFQVKQVILNKNVMNSKKGYFIEKQRAARVAFSSM